MAVNEVDLMPVRDTLINKYGVANERIGWNPKTGYVTIDGRDIFKPSVNREGTTFSDPSEFNSAQGLINQANQAYNLQQRVLNPQQNANPFDQRFNDLLEQLSGRLTNPQQIDRRDVYRSPQFAAQQAQAQQQAQQATRMAQEALGDSGFAQSTRLSDRAQRIQNEANQFLETQVVPQIIQQMQAEQDRQTAALMDLLGVIGQQQGLYDTRANTQFDRAASVLDFLTGRQDRAEDLARLDEQTAYQRQQDALAQQNLEAEKAYRAQRDSEEDRRWWADYERRGQEFAAQQGLQWAQLNQRQREFLADQAYRDAQLNMDQQRIDLQKTQQAAEETGIDEYDLLTVRSMAEQQGLDVNRAKPEEIKTFVAKLKAQFGWSTQEAQGVESYLNSLAEQERAAKEAEKNRRAQEKAEQEQRTIDAKSQIYGRDPTKFPWE